MNQNVNPFPNVSPVWSRYSHIVAERGEGSYIYAEGGRRYLDFTTGIGVTNTGHCHPKVVTAIQEQAAKLIHGQANIVMHRPMLELVDELRTVLHPSLDGFFFSNSGAEAIEGTIKLARMATGRTNVIVFQGSFHGRTAGTMSLTTSKTIYRAGYQPLMPGVFVAPFPYSFRYGWDEETTGRWCLEELEFLLLTQTAPSETAAILIEPVLGEGGYVIPPKSFLQGLRRIADQHGILLILDEIQTGFGRTARWFAYEHFEIVPDIVAIAKGLGSGMPISGVSSPMELMEKWTPGSHGGTYGGNAVAAAAAVATIRAIREEKMLKNAEERGKQLMKGLAVFQKEFKSFADLRGLGLMIACEFRTEEGKPDKELTKAVQKVCLENGLMLLTCGPWDNTLRIIPPINVSADEVDEALEIFGAALDSVSV
ncbi:MAG: aminotransferase class III-fold pyridoxal phosphate-dependent enzyme [Anaerolineales bacterium]